MRLRWEAPTCLSLAQCFLQPVRSHILSLSSGVWRMFARISSSSSSTLLLAHGHGQGGHWSLAHTGVTGQGWMDAVTAHTSPLTMLTAGQEQPYCTAAVSCLLSLCCLKSVLTQEWLECSAVSGPVAIGQPPLPVCSHCTDTA